MPAEPLFCIFRISVPYLLLFLDFSEAFLADAHNFSFFGITLGDRFISNAHRLTAFGANQFHVGRADRPGQRNNLAGLSLFSGFLAFLAIFTPSTTIRPSRGRDFKTLPVLARSFPEITSTLSPLMIFIFQY